MKKHQLGLKKQSSRSKHIDTGSLADPRVLEELDYLRLALQQKQIDQKRKQEHEKMHFAKIK
jgi:hypothetical protein